MLKMENVLSLHNLLSERTGFVRHKHCDFGSKWTISYLLKLLMIIAIISRTCCGQNEQQDISSKQSEKPLVLFISFDGFRYDYLTKTDTPNFDKLIAKGVQADYMIDAMVTKTFPNHYTMVTGLYEESHGVVGNVMYDPVLDEQFWIGDNSSKDPVWWKDGEPIWTTNQKQGGRSAAILYPGSDVNISGTYPTHHLPTYDSTVPYNSRVDMVVPLLANGSINLGILYFSEPDHSGHLYGPNSHKMDEVIQRCDSTVGYLIEQLQQNELYDKVNLVITSDHGMAETFYIGKSIFLEDYIDSECCLIQSNNPLSMIWPHNESETQSIYDALKNVPNLNVYLKDKIPVKYHYSHNQRIPPILAVAEEHWQVFTARNHSTLKGEHGYNNSLMTMHPFFIAHGPAFREGYQMKPFHNVDLYPMLCHILGIEPSVNNGSLDEVKMMLKEGEMIVTSTASPEKTTSSTTPTVTSTTKEGPHIKKVSETPIHIAVKDNISMHALIGLGVACFIALIATFLLVAMCIRQRSYRQPAFEYMPIEDTSVEGQQVLRGPHAAYFYPNTKI